MRMWARLRKPFKSDDGTLVYKIMLFETGEGFYLFAYDSPEAVLSSADYLYDSSEELFEDWNGLVDENGWQELDDPLPDCQHDAFIPLCVKGRNAGKPEWGVYETLKDGEWVDFKPYNENEGNLNTAVYRDSHFTLGQDPGSVFLIAGGRKFMLSCHPYEPCLYIKEENGRLTVVHNAFDPSAVLEVFAEGGKVRSATGLEYGQLEFCKMVEYVSGKGDIYIDDAEKVFGREPVKRRFNRQK
jgi:hypothetical protein